MSNSSVSIRTIISLDDLDQLSSSWREWEFHPNHDYDHYRLICEVRREKTSPYILIAEKANLPFALLACRMERNRFSPQIGYFKPFGIRVRSLNVIHEGAIGRVDEEAAKEWIKHLWILLKTGRIDIVNFHHLKADSPIISAVDTLIPSFCREKIRGFSKHWCLNIPSETGFLLKKIGSKHRSWLKGRIKKLSDKYNGRISWEWLKEFNKFPHIMEEMDVLAKRTYQRGLGAGFVNNEENRRRYQLFAERGQLRIQLLRIDEKIRAFWIGKIYKDVFHSEATGYDPDFGDYRIGTLILIAMTDSLAQEGVSRLDFGLGDAQYKERFADYSWLETSFSIFSPSIKGILLRLIKESFQLTDQALRNFLNKTGILSRVKTNWRRALRKKPTPSKGTIE